MRFIAVGFAMIAACSSPMSLQDVVATDAFDQSDAGNHLVDVVPDLASDAQADARGDSSPADASGEIAPDVCELCDTGSEVADAVDASDASDAPDIVCPRSPDYCISCQTSADCVGVHRANPFPPNPNDGGAPAQALCCQGTCHPPNDPNACGMCGNPCPLSTGCAWDERPGSPNRGSVACCPFADPNCIF